MDESLEERLICARRECESSYAAIEAMKVPDPPEVRAANYVKMMRGLWDQYKQQEVEESSAPHVGLPNINIYEVYRYDKKPPIPAPTPAPTPVDPNNPGIQTALDGTMESTPMEEYRISWNESATPGMVPSHEADAKRFAEATFEERRLMIMQEMNGKVGPEPATAFDFEQRRLQAEKELSDSYAKIAGGTIGPVIGVPNIDIYEIYKFK